PNLDSIGWDVGLQTPSPRVLNIDRAWQIDVQAAQGATTGLAVWHTNHLDGGADIEGAFFGADGSHKLVDLVRTPATSVTPAIATCQGVWLLAWVDWDIGVFAARVDPATGSLLDAPALLGPYTIGTIGAGPVPSVACDGNTFAVLWQENTGLRARRVSTSGT